MTHASPAFLLASALAQPGGNPSDKSLGDAPVATQGVPVVPGTNSLPQAQAPTSNLTMFLPLIVIMVVMVGMTVMSGRREKKKREEMNNSLKRGDVVQTIGGAIGTITDIRDHEVVIRFEDGRIRFAKSAVQTVLKGTKGGEAPQVETKPALSSAANN